MSEDDLEDPLVDHVVDLVMRGEDPDVDGLLSTRPDLPAATREKLRKIAASFGRRSGGAPAARPRSDALPFERLGHYHLLEKLGEGGMGTVYLAEHEFLSRRVALKLLRPELAFSDVTRQRFQREARSIARLRHPHIVAVHDAGEERGIIYIAMELVEGTGLDELVARAATGGGRLAVEESVRYARDVARALQCAHAAGIVHRDVKPSNVRVTPDGRALLLDFGLAFAADLAALSQSGFFRGTPQYASPEQVAPEHVEIDARTDVYSLGVTLYECLTGRAPFQAATPQQLFHQILVRSPEAVRPSNALVDERLEELVLRCLSKRREDRFASAAELADALEAWLARPAAVQVVKPTTAVRRRNRGLVFGAVVLVVALTAWVVLQSGDAAGPGAPYEASAAARKPSAQRTLRPLFGAADAAFGQRLLASNWGAPIGQGTFGDDDEGSGVLGNSPGAMSALPYALDVGVGRVAGRVEPLPVYRPGADHEDPTAAAGACVELSDARAFGVLLSATGAGYRAQAHELRRDGAGPWTPTRALQDPVEGSWGEGRPLTITAEWGEDALRLAFGTTPSGPEHVVPAIALGAARERATPTRMWLLVDRGSARYTEFVLEAP